MTGGRWQVTGDPPLAKHDVVPVGPVHVEVDLPDVGAVAPGQGLHLRVLPLLLQLGVGVSRGAGAGGAQAGGARGAGNAG